MTFQKHCLTGQVKSLGKPKGPGNMPKLTGSKVQKARALVGRKTALGSSLRKANAQGDTAGAAKIKTQMRSKLGLNVKRTQTPATTRFKAVKAAGGIRVHNKAVKDVFKQAGVKRGKK